MARSSVGRVVATTREDDGWALQVEERGRPVRTITLDEIHAADDGLPRWECESVAALPERDEPRPELFADGLVLRSGDVRFEPPHDAVALVGFVFDRRYVLAMWRMQGWFVARLFRRDGGFEAERELVPTPRAWPRVVALAEGLGVQQGLGVQLGRFVYGVGGTPEPTLLDPTEPHGLPLCPDFHPTAPLLWGSLQLTRVEGTTPVSFHADVEIDVTRRCLARLTPSEFILALSATPPPSYEASDGRLRNGDLACTIRW